MKKLVGIIGKTGAGKSTVSDYLRSKGAYIIDGDKVSREVLNNNSDLLGRLTDAFGEDILNTDGTLNRRMLARKAFSSLQKTDLLNSIMHPAINNAISDEVAEAFANYDVVAVDAAALIESGFADKCDIVVTVHAPENIREQRIMKRDGISADDALIRINAQKPDDFYFSKSDIIINNYKPYSLNEQMAQLKKELF